MTIRSNRVLAGLVLIIMLVAMTACGSSNGDTGSKPSETAAATEAGSTDAPKAEGAQTTAPDPAAELAKLATQVLTKGPNGEEPVSAAALELTDADIQALKDKKVTAAISMQYMGNDWSTTQVNALKEQFAKMGIEVVAVTDANFKPEKQTSDIETILAKKPTVLVTIPTDTVATAPIYKKAAEAGVKIVFMNQAADGLKAGTDYSTIVSPDDYANGATAAYYIAKELKGKGNIAVVYHDADFPTTKIRYDAFKTVMAQYPDIKIVEAQGIAGPDFAGDAEKAASAILLKHSDVQAIWGVWDVPAEGIISAARNAGREKDLIITTIDLGKNVAIELAKGGLIKGLGAQTVYDAGVAEAKAAALTALGKEIPPFIVMNGIPTDKSNVLDAWKRVYHQDPPKELTDAAAK
ncbi:substrate-binding domain-containing protein [Paenibacillus athensensis]|uniref:Sugar ABC transporter substrate-binding protein n=1 Tax=Paenibacillus athensensis TaxID=1967502 RepID=A0A4Y8PZW8_9BACL|nr:substrate-binding domain-containing protein [Paenibacillus athensensis]MCD1260410.1 substrate-binding domain-containing protein [Paenibacillus athensensis]